MRLKNLLNKFVAKISEQTEKYMGDIRDSRLLKKSDGISEFFKSMSSIEKGVGEINDVYYDDAPVIVETPPVKTSRKRGPKKKKLKVIETV